MRHTMFQTAHRLSAILFLFLCSTAVSVQAQIQLTVQAVSHRKGVGGGYTYTSTQSSRALEITLKNTTSKPVTGVTVRWGIVKTRSGHYNYRDSDRNWHERAFGGEEKLDLKPLEQKIIETAEVGAFHEDSHSRGTFFGEKITGHGAQVLVGDKVIVESFVPPTIKSLFDKISPVEDDSDHGKSKKN